MIILFGFSLCFIVPYFYLANYADSLSWRNVSTFAGMAYGSVIVLVLYRIYFGEPKAGASGYVVDYDENFNFQSAAMVPVGVLLLLAATFLLTGLISAAGGFSSILYTPRIRFAYTFPAAGVTLLLTTWAFHTFVVAMPEEALKLSGILFLGNRFGEAWGVGLSVGIWAVLHSVQAYASLILVIPAFIAGLILYWLLKVTGNICAPTLAHGAYNTVVSYQISLATGESFAFPGWLSGVLVFIGLSVGGWCLWRSGKLRL